MDEFSNKYVETDDASIFVWISGSGPAVLLLHGFPETHSMWREVAPFLAQKFTVVIADLRGYGKSSCPPSNEDHTPYSKRVMGNDMVEVMRQLGFPRFSVVGHDRGARVAYRMALDHPGVIEQLAVCDIVPTGMAWDKTDARMMLGFWPWSLFAQPSPLPERILQTNAKDIVDNACDQWGSSPEVFAPEIRDEYARYLSDPEHAQAVCEEYRAAATIDKEHDESDKQAERTIGCPVLVLWSEDGGLDVWYKDEGGPLALWKTFAPHIVGGALPGGHFFPESNPKATREELMSFLLQDANDVISKY